MKIRIFISILIILASFVNAGTVTDLTGCDDSNSNVVVCSGTITGKYINTNKSLVFINASWTNTQLGDNNPIKINTTKTLNITNSSFKFNGNNNYNNNDAKAYIYSGEDLNLNKIYMNLTGGDYGQFVTGGKAGQAYLYIESKGNIWLENAAKFRIIGAPSRMNGAHSTCFNSGPSTIIFNATGNIDYSQGISPEFYSRGGSHSPVGGSNACACSSGDAYLHFYGDEVYLPGGYYINIRASCDNDAEFIFNVNRLYFGLGFRANLDQESSNEDYGLVNAKYIINAYDLVYFENTSHPSLTFFLVTTF